MKILFKNTEQPPATDAELNIQVFAPSLRKLFLAGEPKSVKNVLVRISFWLMSKGRLRIFYVLDENGKLMHTSCVMPKCFKFPYMDKDDFVIGPSVTRPQYRGRGIFPSVLRRILKEFADHTVYMVVDEKNTPSIKGVEKAGGVRCGFIHKTKVFKRYYRCEENEGNA